jgi:hypothetical protein
MTGDWRIQDEHRKILILVNYKNLHKDDDQLSWTLSTVSAILEQSFCIWSVVSTHEIDYCLFKTF